MKKSFKTLALMIFVILSAAFIAVSTSAAPLPGDVNGDGEVNIRDAATILQFVTGHDVELVAPCTHSGYVVIDPAVDPTYDKSGLTIGVSCTKCGEKLIEQETVPALGHEHTEAVLPAVPATCQEEGLTEGKYCPECNTVLVKQKSTPKVDHELGDWEAYGSYTVRRCIKSEDCDVSIRVTSISATYNGSRLLTGEQVWKNDVTVTVTLSDNTSFTAKSKEFTLENDVMTVDGNNVVTVKFVNTATTITVPAIHDNLPGTASASDFEYSGADKDAITITKYIGTSANVVIPAHIDRIPVRYIGDSAFSGNKVIQSVTIPGSIWSIGQSAFYNCTGLKTLALNEGLNTIKGQAFMNCPINTLVIPNSVNTIETYMWKDYSLNKHYEGAFEDCKNLQSVVIGSGLTSIARDTFLGCTSLKEVIIGDGVTSIDVYAFSGCSSLTSISMGNSLTTIGSNSFENCTSLKTLNFGPAVQNINSYAFVGCTMLSDINFSGSVTTIGDYAFQNCKALTSVTIPGNIRTIGQSAFYNCTGLKTLVLNEGLNTIKGQAFMNCPINTLIIPNSVNTIETYMWKDSGLNKHYGGAFEGCKNLQSVVIGSGLTAIDRETFQDCSALQNVVIGSSVHTISDYAFSNCTALVTINIPDNVTTIGSNAFKGCTLLENFRLGTGVQSIGASALQDCTSIDTVTIPANVQVIGNNAFTGCVELDETVIEKGALQSIGSNAYSGCSSFDRIYYGGTADDWSVITVNATNVYPLTESPYYYSATSPSASGNYWYYDTNGTIRVWNISETSFKAEEYSEKFAYSEFGNAETSYSNQYLKELKNDSWLQAGIAIWEGLNTVTDFDSKKITKKHVYKLVIYDLLMGEVGSNVNPLACMEEACDSYIFEYAEFFLEDEIADLETLKYLNPALYDEAGFIDKFFKGVDGAEFIFQTTSNLYDALYTCAQYQALSDMDENFYLVLIEISKDSSLPSDLRNAAKECANCYQTASKGMLAKVIAKEFAASTMEDLWLEYAEVAWEAVITSIFPQYKVVEMTVKGVMFLANAGFNLDARNEAYYQLEAAVGLENALRKVIKNTLPDYLRDDLTDKSEYYLYAIEMYQTSVLLGFDYSSSLLSEFSKGLDVNASEKQAYDTTISQLKDMKNSKKQTYNNFDQQINQLFVEYYAY